MNYDGLKPTPGQIAEGANDDALTVGEVALFVALKVMT